ncbi:MAG: hypothetical protein Q4F13_06890 [Pseudomonadota bacterium]|nr:hypothetical protein [Pseudomonadota bacterium]
MQAIGADHKSTQAAIGSLGSLGTANKSSLVAAINELKAANGGKLSQVSGQQLIELMINGNLEPGRLYIDTDFGGLHLATDPSGYKTFADEAQAARKPGWLGHLAGCWGDGDPVLLANNVMTAGQSAIQALQVGTATARAVTFRMPAGMQAGSLYWFGTSSATGVFTAAIYRMGANRVCTRLHTPVVVNTLARTWGSAGVAGGVFLETGVTYVMAFSAVSSTIQTVPAMASSTNVASALGVLTPSVAHDAHDMMPPALRSAGFPVLGQFAVANGQLPPTATFLPPSGWAGSMPAFWLSST